MPQENACPRITLERLESDRLSDHATRSTDKAYVHRIFPSEPDDVRTEFHRDYTRIIHSRAFRRLRQKTQVFIYPENDHLCTRMEHSIHVASVAATIAQVLKLNVDLVRAIAIGHDLGHAPFGHKGEAVLNGIAVENGLRFCHEVHSLRVVDYLESPYKAHHGLNLTFAVRDGIACHYGEGFEKELQPDRKKSYDALDHVERGKSCPATLEGCVVRWADKIAYLGRDLEDALTLGIVNLHDVPDKVKEILGTTNKEIIGRLVRELVKRGIKDDRLSVSEEIYEALNCFYTFSIDHIYKGEKATHSFRQIDRAIRIVFDVLLKHLGDSQGDLTRIANGNEGCLRVFAEFLSEDVREWQNHEHVQLVIDFIAGMTDPFFKKTFVQLFLPKHTV